MTRALGAYLSVATNIDAAPNLGSMRTTSRIDDELLNEAKRIAIKSDRTLKEVIEDSLRETIARRKAQPKRRKVVLPTSGHGGLRPGITPGRPQ
jgi:hypothetical protein